MIVRLPLAGIIFLSLLLSAFLVPCGAEPTNLFDDLPVESLRTAVGHSLKYLRGQPPERVVRLCDGIYDNGWLEQSLVSFESILDEHGNTGPEFSRQVRQQFTICEAASRENLLVTGYYEPEVAGSLTRTETFRYPLYRVPGDLVNRNGRIGRLRNGKVYPYWSRREIERQDKLKGLELVYLADPVECFVLHVQGSGRIRLPDGSVRRVHFAAKNGRSYRSIGRFLVDQGKMDLQAVTMPAIRAYLAAHPAEVADILQYNESFIFFQWGGEAPTPLGSLGEPLTAGRSVALDHARYPAGALGYLDSQKPKVDDDGRITGWEPLERFVLNQDTGSAITGGNRLDIFWGAGSYAEIAAGNMKHPGKLYFLIKKQQHADNQQRGIL